MTVTVLKPASVVSNEKTTDEVLKLPDLLYAGLQALDADRLLSPENNNAFNYFSRALVMGDRSTWRYSSSASRRCFSSSFSFSSR